MSSPLLYSDSPRLAGFIRWADGLFGLIAALILVFIMLLTCADVIGRYFLNMPVPGAFEITELAMGALIFVSLPLVTLRREHVTVDLLANFVPKRLRVIQLLLLDLLSITCVGVIGWRVWLKAVEMTSSGDTTATLEIIVYPLVYYMSAMTFLTAALIALLAWHDIFGAKTNQTG
ncbi:MAG: TRAP transporter small permease [Sulfuritalea sp.]|nr:TRAP transporter small permease [Sulfuritalea sp.]